MVLKIPPTHRDVRVLTSGKKAATHRIYRAAAKY